MIGDTEDIHHKIIMYRKEIPSTYFDSANVTTQRILFCYTTNMQCKTFYLEAAMCNMSRDFYMRFESTTCVNAQLICRRCPLKNILGRQRTFDGNNSEDL